MQVPVEWPAQGKLARLVADVARRNVDFSPYGPDEMSHIEANLTDEEFQQGAGDRSVAGRP